LAIGAVTAVFLPLSWRWLKLRPEVANRTVFVTGGSEGLGKAIAADFVARGANVVIMARSENKLRTAVKDLEAKRVHDQQRIGFQSLDVTSWESVENGMAVAVHDFGPPDFLVTGAGAAYPGYFLDMGVEIFEQSMRLNYMGNVHAIKAVAPLMVDRGRGNIMIVGSACSVVSFIGYSSYSPTKFALRGLADSLRSELSGFGIRVSICYPPDVDTPGFWQEEKIKPAETKSCFPSSPWPADHVARQSVSSFLTGDYHIQSVDLLQNALISNMAGVTPRICTVLEALAAPLSLIVTQVFWLWFDFQAQRYAKSRSSMTSLSYRSGTATASAACDKKAD